MREWWRHVGAVGVCAAAAVLAGCGSASGPATPPTAPAAAPPKPLPYDLSTHCGIDYAQVGNRYYEAAAPLSGGSGNPYQPGSLTVVTSTQAILTDKAGRRVVFTLVPSAPGRTTTRVCS